MDLPFQWQQALERQYNEYSRREERFVKFAENKMHAN